MIETASHSEIWSALKNGDQDALLALYRLHYLGLMNYGIKISGDPVLAKDCFTQVLLKLWDNRRKLPQVENTRSYLLTCMRNELFAEMKGANKRSENIRQFNREGEQVEFSYEEHIISVQSGQEIKNYMALAIEKLTRRERELLRLRFFEDRAYDEIAESCGITRRTAYNIIHAALKTLKEELLMHRKGKFLLVPLIPLLATHLS